MSKTSLSKSTYVRGLQCLKSLYLYKHHYKLKDPVSTAQQAMFDGGTNVGLIAQDLFPGGVDCTPDHFYETKKAIQATKAAIDSGAKVIYEAAFEYDNVLVYADILVNDAEGWKLYEVKSSTSVKEVHLNDSALQWYVISNAGIDLIDISIVFINNQYIKNGALDIAQLFTFQSVKTETSQLLESIPDQIKAFQEMLIEDTIPEVAISPHCNEPYPCDYKGHCTKHIPKDSVFQLANLHLKKKFELYNRGIVRLADIPEDYKLSEKQAIQVEGVRNGTNHVDKTAIKEFVEGLSYPLYYLDFETMNPAIPIFDMTKPYEAMVFQYSLHVQQKANSDCQHFEYLAKTDGSDPRITFIEQLIQECGSTGDILVYNIGFERGKLINLAEFYPRYANELRVIIDRLKDLMIPFQKGWYYSPAMKGSYSIKSVLPALVPNLSYKDLNIQEGGSASSIFAQMAAGSFKGDATQTRKDLLEYCKLDTWAIVKILDILQHL